MIKTYLYKIYDSTGVYITTWNDVVSEPKFSKIINGSLSDITITLARKFDSFGEGEDVTLNNKVEIYCIDKEAPNGILIYSGYISGYEQNMTEKGESVDIICLPYASMLEQDILVDGSDTTVTYSTEDPSNMLSSALTVANQKTTYTANNYSNVVLLSNSNSKQDLRIVSNGIKVYYIYREYDGSYYQIWTAYSDLDGTGFTTTKRTTSSYSKISPDVCVKDDKVYYVWLDRDGALYEQIFIATTDLSGGTYTVSKLTTTAYNKAYINIKFDVNKLYISWFQNDLSFYSQIWLGSINFDLSGFTSAQMSSQSSGTIGTFDFEVTDKCYYTWTDEELTGTGIYIASSELDGSNWNIKIVIEDALEYYHPELHIVSDKIYLTYYSEQSKILLKILNTSFTELLSKTVATISTGSLYHLRSYFYENKIYYLFCIDDTTYKIWSGSSLFNGEDFDSFSVSDTTYESNGTFLGAFENNIFLAWDSNVAGAGKFSSRYYLTNPSIELTGESLSYTFNTSTYLQAINKILEMAPTGWWFYIGADNLLQFHSTSTLTTHTLVIGVHLAEVKPMKRMENVKNIVLFVGDGIYKKYVRSGSVTSYGQRVYVYQDNRVSIEATADILSDNFLDNNESPEIRTNIRVVDSNLDGDLGYDIESINPGDTILLKGFGTDYPASTWDIMQLDISAWDFSIAGSQNLPMRVVSVKYHADYVDVELSSRPIPQNKRIEDIYRNVVNYLNTDNPTAPTT